MTFPDLPILGPRRGRLPFGAALAALAAGAALAPVAPADAAPRAHVASIACWPQSACAGERRAVRPGGTLALAGRGFAPGVQVRFLGRPRDRRDDRAARPFRLTRTWLAVRVPRGAASGAVVVRLASGRLSNLAGPLRVRVASSGRDMAGSARPVRTTVGTVAAAATAAVVAAAVTVPGGDSGPAPAGRAPAPAPTTTPLPAQSSPAPAPAPAPTDRPFAPDSVWNTRVDGQAGVDPASPAMVAALRTEVAREQAAGIGPYINTSQYSTPIYKVGPDQPNVYVHLDDPDKPWRSALQSAFAAVPIPADAVPAVGSDGHMTVWQPSTDRLWEFWRARREADGWHASWGGAIERVSQSPGYYRGDSWAGAQSGWGSSATSLPVLAGTMRIDELRAGRVDHAINLTLPAPRAGVHVWPAQRTDGFSTASDSIPEGAHLRLDPDLDLSKLAMPKMTRMIAEAAQRYGLLVTDKSGVVAFSAEDPTPTGANPYHGPGGLYEGKWPVELLRSFPWEHLQVLPMDIRGG